jgi:hypothetical protein
MDDTAIVATSEQTMQTKLRALKDCTDRIGMVIHPRKSKYIALNLGTTDPFVLDNVEISLTEEYTRGGGSNSRVGGLNLYKLSQEAYRDLLHYDHTMLIGYLTRILLKTTGTHCSNIYLINHDANQANENDCLRILITWRIQFKMAKVVLV